MHKTFATINSVQIQGVIIDRDNPRLLGTDPEAGIQIPLALVFPKVFMPRQVLHCSDPCNKAL